MPWNVSDVVEQRSRFLDDYDRDAYSIAELCRMYEISRQTGYKLLKRREQEGAAGLLDRSQTPRWQEEIIMELRQKHPRWGPKKLLWRLERDYPATGWPVVSTIGDLLHREGLTILRRKRRRTPPYTEPFVAVRRPNLVWCMDFKGHFRTGTVSASIGLRSAMLIAAICCAARRWRIPRPSRCSPCWKLPSGSTGFLTLFAATTVRRSRPAPLQGFPACRSI